MLVLVYLEIQAFSSNDRENVESRSQAVGVFTRNLAFIVVAPDLRTCA